MADQPQQTTFQTPEAMATTIKKKYPVYAKIDDKTLVNKVLTKYPQYWDHVDKANFEKSGFKPEAVTPPPTPEPAKPKEPSYAPTWWGRKQKELGIDASWGNIKQNLPHPELGDVGKVLKDLPGYMGSLVFGGSGQAGQVPTPADKDMQDALHQSLRESAAKGDVTAQTTLQLEQAALRPRINVSGTKTFQGIFDPESKRWIPRFTTGTVKAGENLTSLDNIYALSAIAVAPESIAKPVGGAFTAQLIQGGAQGIVDAAKKSTSGQDQGEAAEAWGNLFGNALFVVGMHFGSRGYESFRERDNTAILNDHSQELYKKKFADLDDQQKAHVMYSAMEESSPQFKARVNAEVERINKKQGRKTGTDVPDAEVVSADRVEAAKAVINRIATQRARQEAYRQHAAAQEAEVRRQAYLREKAADQPPAGTSIEQQRGFPSEESRVTALLPNRGSVMTTEREGQMFNPEPDKPEATPKVEDRRFWIGDRDLTHARAHEAETPIQQFAEQRTGVSFSQLPVARQRVMARYFERFQPEQWEAFKKTPAYAEFMGRAQATAAADATLKPYLDRNPTGENVPLAPDADLHAGLAKLILARTDIDAALKADPATHRDLNEHAEKSMGYSFDSLKPEDRPAALAEYLRDKPEKVGAFLTPDLTERIQSGQHIDLANMAATLADRQQVQVLMSHRDAVRREMDADAMQQMVLEERGKHDAEIASVLRAAPTGETRSFETVDDAARGLTAMAEKLNLGQVSSVDDVFKVEQEARKLPKGLRTPEINQFLTRMRIARVAAEDHILRQMAEESASKMRSDPDSARESAAREVVNLTSQAADLKRTADHLPPEEAAPVRETAAFLDGKANAIVAGAEAANNPPPERPLVRPEIPLSVGRATRVVYPAKGEGLPAHYAIVDASALQTSHMPLSYEERPGYDQNGQPRKYDINRTAQEFIESRAGNLDLDILLSNDPQTAGGPPVADQRMHVISGNGRSLYLLTALERSPAEFQRYLRELHERAAGFGLDPADLTKYKNPVLVKILDEPIASAVEWARMGREMNVDPALGMSGEEMGVALARLLTPENTERLAGIIDSLPTVDADGKALTVREAMRARSKEIATLMTDTGIISAHKSEEFLENGELKGKAKDLFESMLAGLTVSDPAILKDASVSTRDKLARAGLYFVQARGAGDSWNLTSYNTDAVDLLNRAQTAEARLSDLVGKDRAARQKKEGKRDDISRATGRDDSIVEKFLHPERYLDAMNSFAFDDQPLHPPVPAAVEALAMALEESPKAYASLIATYAYDAKNGGQTLYGAEHPATAFTNNIASKYDLKVDPDEWGMVHGLPESVKAGLEAGRDPLPVEPAVHAETVIQDVTPDASSVTDVLKGGPRTVAELRTALAGHPNLSVAEADGLATVFETVLPRAIGESFEDLLGNRRLSLQIGGADGRSRGYHEIVEDGKAIIRLCDSGESSTFLHEMAHYIRQYLKPEDQAVANGFVGARPGEDWTDAQEEKFAEAFERYHYDGGIRRGKLEAVFATLHRAMQSIYNAMTSLKLAKGTPELNAMFDRWYDWQRSERKPVTARLDVDALEDAAKGKVTIPEGARRIDGHGVVSDGAQTFIHLDKEDALAFVKDKKNGVRSWELFQKKGDDTVYVRADLKKGRRLHQAGLNDAITLARQARDLEAQLKKTTDPREQARLRGALNGIEDKLRGSTFVIGGKSDPPDTSATQLIYGVGEKPTVNEPTTPAQAVTAQQKQGDPTGVSLGGEREPRKVSDEPARDGEARADRVPEPEVRADGKHGAGKPAPIARPDKHPLAEVKAAKLKSPDRPRGTPVVDPEVWRGHVEALGLPDGTPPPTIRAGPDVRQLAIYPGQAEAMEGALSALQQYDGTILAAPTGSGKCLGRGTPILMFDGTTKSVEDVIVGDLLMGPDSKPRTVLSLAHGEDEMFRVTPVKGDTYTVNRAHILSLKRTEDGKHKDAVGGAIVNVSIDEWLAASKYFRHTHKGWRTGVDFEAQDVPLPPYLLGIWLGDGTAIRPEVSKPDKQIRDYMHWIAAEYGLHISTTYGSSGCPSYCAVGKKGKKNPLWAKFRALNLENNKHIPQIYKSNSAIVRRELLAGVIDTDGSISRGGCDITLKEKTLADDVVFVARSLGFAAYTSECEKTCTNNGVTGTYYRTYISGDLSDLPMRLPRKQTGARNQKKSVLVTGIKVEPIGRGEYFGFEIDGDRLFMLGDFTVTHNTFMLSTIANHLLGDGGDKIGLIVTRSQNLIHEADGYIEWGRKVGLTVEGLPSKMNELQTGGAYAATYAQIRGAKDVFSIPWDFVLFDESAEARNWTDSEQGKAVVLLGHAAKKVVYASATPYHTVMELGYMHKLGMWPHGGFTQWAEQFGLREVAPNTFAGGTSAAKLEKLRQQLVERGQWQTLYKDMDGVEAHVAMVPQTDEVKEGVRNIRAAFAMAAKAFEKAGMSRYLTPTAGHEAIYLKRYIAGSKLQSAIELGKKLAADGWAPLFFSEYRSPADEGMEFFHNLPGDLGKRINKMLPPLPDIVGEMRKAFGEKVGIFAGDANQIRAGELEGFMSGEKDALYMTYSAGAVGANAQDKVGDRPRAAVFIDLPWSGIMFEQGTGRPWRYGTRSNVSMFMLTSDALPEMKVLATKILPRMRSLRAAVYGEKVESNLSKSLRESVGIPEEMLQYEQGQEYKPQAAEFEQQGEGASYTHIDDLELPSAKKAMNKGMKYKGKGRLYQGPKDEDPFHKAANDAWGELLERVKNQPAGVAGVFHANEGVMRMEAADAGRKAMGTGEPVEGAIKRRMRDMENDTLIWMDDLKDAGRAGVHFAKSSIWMFGTSGDRAIEKIFREAGMPQEGAEMKRRIVDYDIRSGNYRAELGGMVAKIIHENKLTPPEHELVTKVVENQATSDDPRINKAADDYRKFFAFVRRRLADAGAAVTIYGKDGKAEHIPYTKIADDSNYWPRLYDWNKKIVLVDPKTGEKTITTLGKVRDMPTSDERREKLIDRIAEQRGISKMMAQAFLENRQRGIRLAGNVERAREFDIPMYGRDRRAIERYVNEVSETIAASEVHGQNREKTDALLNALPYGRDRELANHIVTADLDPARLGDEDRVALRAANRALVLSKMTLSFMKVGFHQVKTSMATNTRSVARAIIETAIHPRDVYQNASDCGALVNYMRTAWMREYGMKTGGFDQKMLDYTGFTPLMYFTRMTSAAAGRLWLEKYVYPELAKDPKNPILRRKLTDLYGYTDEQIDHLAANGYGPADVKRVSLAAANWTTGSGRPSELPPALRGYSGDPLLQRLTTIMRIAQSLHGFMFKTANLVNRTVWQELYHEDPKSFAPYHLIGRFAVNFGLAGLALNEMLYLRHKISGSNEANIEERRREWLLQHPASKEALFYAMSDISMGMGLEPLTQLTQELATANPKDREKLAQQHRTLNAAGELVWGVAGESIWDSAKATNDYAETFHDTGNHRLTPEERRAKILEQLTNEEVPASRFVLKPHPAPAPVHHPRRRKASTMLH